MSPRGAMGLRLIANHFSGPPTVQLNSLELMCPRNKFHSRASAITGGLGPLPASPPEAPAGWGQRALGRAGQGVSSGAKPLLHPTVLSLSAAPTTSPPSLHQHHTLPLPSPPSISMIFIPELGPSPRTEKSRHWLVRQTWVQIPASARISCVSLEKPQSLGFPVLARTLP